MPGVTVDDDDNVWILHRGNNPVLCFTREGKFIRSFGDEYIKGAHGLKIAPDRTVWVTDIEHHVVMQFTMEGELIRTLGTKGEPGESDRNFNKPTDVAFLPSGDFYVTDGYGNSRVVKFSSDYKYQFAWGDSGNGEGQFYWPHAVSIDAKQNIYVCDRENSRIQVFTPEGEFIKMWTHIGQPWGVCIPPGGNIFTVDGKNMKAMMLTSDGAIITSWGELGAGPGQFNLSHQIAVDSHGDVYITEIENKRVQKFARSM